MKHWVGIIMVFVAGIAGAQKYPERPVRLVVGYPPGGPTDFVARAYAGRIDRKSTRLNSSHVSESRMPSSA